MTAVYLHGSSFNRDSLFILDEALDAAVSLSQEEQHGGAVVVPELGKLLSRRKLAAGELEGDLHASVPDVVVVLHAAGQRVPCSAVGGAVAERRSSDLEN